MNKTPVMLVIMDGFGIAPDGPGNAIYAASTPNIDALMKHCPRSALKASGLDVGLPDGQMGNSEVGHTNIGAGRVVFQDLPRITKAISDGDFFENPTFRGAIQNAIDKGTALHLAGLMSDGGVHSHNTHTWAFLELCKRMGLDRVYIHCFMDGRDVPPESGAGFIRECAEKCREIGVGKIATVMGRYYAMDRDNRWERVEKAYAAMVYRDGVEADDPVKAMEDSYGAGVTDEFVLPVCVSGGAPIGPDDSVIFTNFRPDRAREITRTFVDPNFEGFERKKGFFPLRYVCTTQYDAEMPNVEVAFKPQSLQNTFGEYISSLGLKQLRIAETEKYAHVTFFFNGGVEKVYEGEDRALIPSPKVATYDLQPEMSAYPVTDEVVARIESRTYDVIILNFANCDMVGHTGVLEAAVKAVETVDTCVGRVIEAMNAVGGITMVTADHGNADQMLEPDGVTPFTAHTTNLVPFVISGADVTLTDGCLADIAPTMLDLMGLDKPEEMTGKSLIRK
ncbi:2,3-bisphosphoglycerate-independent phosphoglycerate mutase [Oscillospiraceae bacterium OttesenSCG-928-F05]|nr:2,3-bisphosphoglycerate-independent phosphoglycerate mutase [Oscillospiraceae bacterium OttesenSCG-928-F05]